MIETALMTLWRIDEQDELNDRPRRLLDQYAHELAEKIRTTAEASEREGHSMTAGELADLIDPEAQT